MTSSAKIRSIRVSQRPIPNSAIHNPKSFYFCPMHPQSRVWIFQSNRPLSDAEVVEIDALLDRFAKAWTAHDLALKASGSVYHNRFVVLVVDETQAPASGCSIDKSVHFLQGLEQQYRITLFDRLHLAYRSEGSIHTLHRSDIAAALADGRISADTVVFHNLVATKAEFDQSWERPLRDSWAGALIPA